MWAGQKVQRRHQEPHEIVRNQRGRPVQRLTQSHLLAYLGIDEQSGSSVHNHSTTVVPGRVAAAPGSATPELDSTYMNGLIDDKKRSVVPTVQSNVCVCVCVCVSVCLCLSVCGVGHTTES